MSPFPFFLLTWRESIVGFRPTEMVYMQVQKDWVSFNPRGEAQGNGFATGRNLGFVKWSMKTGLRGGQDVWVLRSESFDRTTEETRVEEVAVLPGTDRIVFQREERSVRGLGRAAETTFAGDHVEVRRVLSDGTLSKALTMVPAGGMETVQRRFARSGKAPRDFLVVDGIEGRFRKVHVEAAGRYAGTWGSDRYAGNAYRFDCEGRSQTVMLSEADEIVKIEFDKDVTLTLMSQPRSRRFEDAYVRRRRG